jgi:hypothetical protein
MTALRPLLTLAAVLALTAGCTRTISGSGAPDGSMPAAAARTAAPTPTATYNGVASMSGDEALGTAYEALRHAPSVRLKGYLGAGADRWSLRASRAQRGTTDAEAVRPPGAGSSAVKKLAGRTCGPIP